MGEHGYAQYICVARTFIVQVNHRQSTFPAAPFVNSDGCEVKFYAFDEVEVAKGLRRSRRVISRHL